MASDRWGAWCVLLWMSMAPAWAQAALFGDDVARRQIADQGRRIEELRIELKAQADALNGRVSKLDEAVRGTSASQQSMLELVNQIESLKREIQSLRGQIEVVNNNVESNAKRQRDMYVDVDNRLRRLEQGAGAPAGAAPSDAPPPPSAAAPSAPPAPFPAAGPAGKAAASADEARAYESAQQQRRIGNFQGAVKAFQSFLTQYPRSPLAHRAQYWIGDSYFNLKDYKNAIASQQKLIATWPDSLSAPDAMLNIASSQSELGEGANARRTMDALVSRYPGTEAAAKAKRRLTSLR
jgi:tol-pal system protein YbgF